MRIIIILVDPIPATTTMTQHRPSDPIQPDPQARVPGHPPAATRGIDSHELMRGSREVQIRHAGQVYRLRHTRNDKLILVK
jgi:hemin uptake protein HemP